MNPSEDPGTNSAAAHAPLHAHGIKKAAPESSTTNYDASFKGPPQHQPKVEDVYSPDEIEAHNAKLKDVNHPLYVKDEGDQVAPLLAEDVTEDDPGDSDEGEEEEEGIDDEGEHVGA